jgi:hypothetical protein
MARMFDQHGQLAHLTDSIMHWFIRVIRVIRGSTDSFEANPDYSPRMARIARMFDQHGRLAHRTGSIMH